ncbi:MAG TPA: 30S ribosome-binding factor RbfA [Chthoniobacterales bacterium]|nr:30S ribosome-binding factor RbfA [Chthoniobacterales bacterium]
MKYRLERVREVLKRELGIIMGREIRFTSPLVTVSGVDITPDLKQAHVFVSVIGNDRQQREAIELLEQNRVLLQSELSKRVVIKYTPHLNFRLDGSIERGARIITIMEELGLSPDKSSEEDEGGDEDEREHVKE